MNRLHRIIHAFDEMLVIRIFTPIAHWIDWRFHRNQFDLAGWCLSAAMALLAADAALDFFYGSRFSWMFGVGVFIFNSFQYLTWLKNFGDASVWQENNPGKLHPRHHFWIVVPCYLRMVFIAFGSLFTIPATQLALLIQDAYHFLSCLTALWFFMIGIAVYFASTPPATRDRRKAPERTPMLAAAPSQA